MYTFCNECPYNKKFKPVVYQKPTNDMNINVVFVLDTPNKFENDGRSNDTDKRLLYEMVERAGIKKFYITTLCKCHTEEKLKNKAVNACKELLTRELNILKPKIVVGMGEHATKLLSGKNKAFSFLRGYINYNDKYSFFNINTFTPKNILKSYTNFTDFNIDFIKLGELYKKVKDVKPTKKLIEDIVSPIKNIEFIKIDTINNLSKLDYLAGNDRHKLVVDLETSGLKKGDNVLLIGLYDLGIDPLKGDRNMFIISENVATSTKSHDLLQDILESNDLITQNGKFDLRFISEAGNISLDLYTLNNFFDTMIAHICIDERLGTHGLKVWSKDYFNATDWEADIKQYLPNKNSSYSLIPRDKLEIYLTYDLHYTAKGYLLFDKLIDREDMRDYFNMLMTRINTFTQIEHEGILVSKELPRVKRELEREQKKALDTLITHVYTEGFTPEQYVKDTGAKTPPKAGDFNPKSNPQAQYVFYDLLNRNAGKELIPLWEDSQEQNQDKKMKKSCCKEAVEAYRIKHPLWESLYNYKNFGDVSFMKALTEKMDYDGIIRPSFAMAVSSGRMSSSKFNMQNLKNGSPIKNLILPDEDCVMLDFDYCTLEVIIAGLLSGDEEILKVFRSGGDFHSINTENIFVSELSYYRQLTQENKYKGIMEHVAHNSILAQARKYITECKDINGAMRTIFKAYRQKSKAVTFGVLYSRGAESLANKELNCTKEQAQQWINNFYAKFHVFKKWSDDTAQFACREGHVKTFFGHKRRFPFVWDGSVAQIKRQAPNTVIQGTASQITTMALERIHKIFKTMHKCRILFTVHDSIVASVHKSVIREAIDIITLEMCRNPIISSLSLGVEGTIGLSYGTTEDITEEAIIKYENFTS